VCHRGKEGKAFFDGLASKIVEVLPGARVEIRFTSSNVWTHLAEAANEAPSLVVYATDGHVNDDGTPAIRRTLKAGPKAIAVDVSARAPAIPAEVAAATGGTRVEASDTAAFEREVVEAAKVAPPTGYDLTYPTRREGPDRRRLVVSTRDDRHREKNTYVVPPENERAVGNAILGLHLEVKMDRRQSITPIAGAPYRNGGQLEESARRRAARQARRGLYAKAMVSLEAGMPSRTQLADDFLTARLSRRDLHRALEAGGERLDADGERRGERRSTGPHLASGTARIHLRRRRLGLHRVTTRRGRDHRRRPAGSPPAPRRSGPGVELEYHRRRPTDRLVAHPLRHRRARGPRVGVSHQHRRHARREDASGPQTGKAQPRDGRRPLGSRARAPVVSTQRGHQARRPRGGGLLRRGAEDRHRVRPAPRRHPRQSEHVGTRRNKRTSSRS